MAENAHHGGNAAGWASLDMEPRHIPLTVPLCRRDSDEDGNGTVRRTASVTRRTLGATAFRLALRTSPSFADNGVKGRAVVATGMNKSKRLVAGLGAAAVIGAAVAITGGTYAYFTDSAQTAEQSIEAGDLEVRVDQSGHGVSNKPVEVTNAAPGDVYVEDLTFPFIGQKWYRMKVTNTGSIDGEINSLEIVDLAGSDPNLADRLQIRAVVRQLDFEPGSFGNPGFEPLDSGRLDNLPGIKLVPAGSSVYVYFQIEWPNGSPEEDNPYMNATTSFKFQVNLDQFNQGN
ncbi:spore coat-associated protein N [Thermobifida halotolerans]|uniref:TasA family protein n=1 Tax=Thermobifida halotolerans TaxID=483545 RepID=UPI001FB2929D|nr:TasA family protein [Thermobifida halotolerans]